MCDDESHEEEVEEQCCRDFRKEEVYKDLLLSLKLNQIKQIDSNYSE